MDAVKVRSFFYFFSNVVFSDENVEKQSTFAFLVFHGDSN